ncbi:MAG: CHRD domain-containing protein [Bernardetiaceae bacterium]|nr:CHRD domain-containing protein [Bernardetiaceae bacterium]
MKNPMFQYFWTLLLAGLMIFSFASCNNDDDEEVTPEPDPVEEFTGQETAYNLAAVAESGVSGTVTFREKSDGSTQVVIALTGTPEGGSHPAHIHENDVETTGGIAVMLTNVNGDTGESVTEVTEKADGTAITYAELIQYNGYVNVHLSDDDLETIVAQGNIGANAE